MNGLLILIPVALFLGGLGVAAFIWSLRSGQFDDLEGASWRILQDDDKPKPEFRDQDPTSFTKMPQTLPIS